MVTWSCYFLFVSFCFITGIFGLVSSVVVCLFVCSLLDL